VAGSLVCGRGLANPGQPPFAVTEMCKLLCQFPPIILHISDLGCRFPPVAAPVSTCDRLRDLSVQPGTHGAEKFRPHCTQFRFTAGISEAVHTRRESGQHRTTVVRSLVYFLTFQAVTSVCSCASLPRRFRRPARRASCGSRADIGPTCARRDPGARFDVTR
jgi:hypothetical protein